jgi:hypothetical protein
MRSWKDSAVTELYNFPEPFHPGGNITGQGINNVMGAPDLDRIEVLVRETVQNVWDAGLAGETPSICFHVKTLDSSSGDFLRGLFENRPDREHAGDLHQSLLGESIRILEIEDGGTSGLGGPVTADVEQSDDESPDFVQFLRNVGSPRDKELGGGTYGFGKSSIYGVSNCQTILVHTVCTHDGELEERFIAYRVGGEYTSEGKRYTGRQWWGQVGSDDCADPLTGDAAARIAEALGMPERSGTRRGTTIWILDPVLVGLEDETCSRIRDAILVHCWPKMVPLEEEDGRVPMHFSIKKDGEDIPIPDLSECPPLSSFAEALLDARMQRDCREIRCQRPVKKLGALSLKKIIKEPRSNESPAHGRGFGNLIPDPARSVALMRPVELVVRYIEADPLSNPAGEYVGVFICDPTVEQAFAHSEPPSHDDWHPDYLDGHDRTFVRVALKRIKEAMMELARPPEPVVHVGTSTADVADRLGAVLLGAEGPGPGGARSPASPSSPGTRSPVKVAEQHPQVFEDQPCAVFLVTDSDGNAPPAGLELKPRILDMDGGGQTVEGEDLRLIVAIIEEGGEALHFTSDDTGKVCLQDPPGAPLRVFVAYPAAGEFAVRFEAAVTS